MHAFMPVQENDCARKISLDLGALLSTLGREVKRQTTSSSADTTALHCIILLIHVCAEKQLRAQNLTLIWIKLRL